MEFSGIDKVENNDGSLNTNDLTNEDGVLNYIDMTIFNDSFSCRPPKKGDFPGEANFEFLIDGSHTRTKFSYSTKLGKLYVDIGVDIPLIFNWDPMRFHDAMYVRATVVYSDPEQAQKKVEVCTNHSLPSMTNMANSVMCRNVLRSGREPEVPNLYYCGSPDNPNSWYSILIAGSPPLEHPYKFVCKNSCPSGINRRNIEIMFTLEDVMCQVLGRQTLRVRVCSVPKRDLARDEAALESHGVKRSAPPQQYSSSKKKIVLQKKQQQDKIVTLPPISVVGLPAAISGLQVMLAMQEQALAIKTENQKPVDDIKKCITELHKCIEDLDEKNNEDNSGSKEAV